jgi:hypothetical protein
MTLAAFRVRFQEFQSAPDELITDFLARAAGRIDPLVWADKTDEGHGLLTAHLLANSPNGQMARLSSDKGTTTYWTDYKSLREEVTCGLLRVP